MQALGPDSCCQSTLATEHCDVLCVFANYVWGGVLEMIQMMQ